MNMATKRGADPANLSSTAEQDVTLAAKRRKPQRNDNYRVFRQGITTATLVVEDEKLYVIKEVLAVSSPVFERMFNSNFKEGNSCEVEFPGKSLQPIIWLLDYLYPETELKITDQIAVALLPLAHEYQMPKLQNKCVSILAKQESPSLEVAALARSLDKQDLYKETVNACVTQINSKRLEEQLKLAHSKELGLQILVSILRKKLDAAAKRNGLDGSALL